MKEQIAFFTLGISKASAKPSVILTTSGTAVANLLPAVIEVSDLSTTPLIIITALIDLKDYRILEKIKQLIKNILISLYDHQYTLKYQLLIQMIFLKK